MISSAQTDTLGFGYPRPQLRRDWESLNGTWKFAFDDDASCDHPSEVSWTHQIVVPFACETQASGIARMEFCKAVWYHLERKSPPLMPGQRLILHFGAIDFGATVWVNGHEVVKHEGGYTPFSSDITRHLRGEGHSQIIEVRAFDNPHDLEQNRGKQDWLKDAHGIWYPRTTGIWQTVWWEVVSSTHIDYIDWLPCMKTWTVDISVELTGRLGSGNSISIELLCNGTDLARVTFGLSVSEAENGCMNRKIYLPEIARKLQIPENPWGMLNHDLIWSPEHPNLIQAKVELTTSGHEVIDTVASYTAFRTFERHGRQLHLNGAPISERFRNGDRPGMLRLALEQGYWRDTGMTPPNDRALESDVLLAKSVFHGVRKHNKLEDPRYLYWADVHGLLVWEELPSAYLFSPKSVRRSIALWQEAIRRDKNHPCIIAWVPINESWQVPSLDANSIEGEAQRQYVMAMYHLTKSLTNNAVVVGNDGWEMPMTDILAVHDYHWSPDSIALRYENSDDALRNLFENERPGGKKLLVGDFASREVWHEHPTGLTEFGGIALTDKPGDWGYSTATSPEDFLDRFQKLMAVVTKLESLQVFCYTELYDVYQEANGLFTMERVPKAPVEAMRGAIFGDT